MPRTIPSAMLTTVAIDYLLDLYKQEKRFIEEWKSLREPHIALLTKLAKFEALAQINLLLSHLHSFEYVVVRRYVEHHLKSIDPALMYLPDWEALDQEYDLLIEPLNPYKHQLVQFAYRWKLRAWWASDELLENDINDIKMGMLKSLKIPEEAFTTGGKIIIDYPEPVIIQTPKYSFNNEFFPPMKIEISWLSLLEKGRREILKEIGQKLAAYEAWAKEKGSLELPSRLKKHARWWFEHNVHNKSYDNIAQDETYSPGGSLISYSKNVGRAVREFGELIDGEVKSIK